MRVRQIAAVAVLGLAMVGAACAPSAARTSNSLGLRRARPFRHGGGHDRGTWRRARPAAKSPLWHRMAAEFSRLSLGLPIRAGEVTEAFRGAAAGQHRTVA